MTTQRHTKRNILAAVAFVVLSVFGSASVASADQPKGGYTIPTAIVMCESGGNYKAENPTSTASGAYQIIDGTWNGFGGYKHASSAPKNVQDLKAAMIWNNGRGRNQWVCKG